MSYRCACSDFCDELAGAAETSFFRAYRGDPESRLLGQTENLAVIADLSPLTLGHILILSRQHYLNFAQVVEAYPFEITTLLNLLRPQYVQTFGRMTILEHGSAENMVNGACITHAHLHLLPISRQAVDETIESDGLHWTPAQPSSRNCAFHRLINCSNTLFRRTASAMVIPHLPGQHAQHDPDLVLG